MPFKFQYKLYEAEEKEIADNQPANVVFLDEEEQAKYEEEKAKKRNDIVWDKRLMKREFF
mgnify:CR=1 FL=1